MENKPFYSIYMMGADCLVIEYRSIVDNEWHIARQSISGNEFRRSKDSPLEIIAQKMATAASIHAENELKAA